MSTQTKGNLLSAFAIYKSKCTPVNKKKLNKSVKRLRKQKTKPLVLNIKRNASKKVKKASVLNTDEEEVPTLIPIEVEDIIENANKQYINDNEIKICSSQLIGDTVYKGKNCDRRHKSNVKKYSGTDIEYIDELKQEKYKISHFKTKNDSERNHEDTNFNLEPEQIFQWLIAPIVPDTFFNDYWEKQVLHISRKNKQYFKHILDSQTLDTMFRENVLHYTRNVDVVIYENGEKKTFNQEGRAVASALWDYYSNGCSIRILNPQTYIKKIHLLIATLQEYFGTMVGTNVYLTPPESQGFAPHFDDIEAFIIQLEGVKHWSLYKPKNCDLLARYSSVNLSREGIGKPFMEVTLKAGDILYFPRGTIHEGFTDKLNHSLHITVSVYQKTAFVDLLEKILPQALKTATENNIEFRQGLPLNYLKNVGIVNSNTNTQERQSIKKKVKRLFNSLVDYLDVDNAADQLGRAFMHDSMPPILSQSEIRHSSKGDGPVLMHGKVLNKIAFNSNIEVRLLRYYCIRLVKNMEEVPKLYYNVDNAQIYHGEEEQFLELDEFMIDVIEKLQNTYPNYLLIDSLIEGEHEEELLQFLADMWETGLLLTKKPLDS